MGKRPIRLGRDGHRSLVAPPGTRTIRAGVPRQRYRRRGAARAADEDLISIGVTSVGHRRKLLAAIAARGAAAPGSAVIAASRDAPQAGQAGGKVPDGSELRRSGSHETRRWREMDS